MLLLENIGTNNFSKYDIVLTNQIAITKEQKDTNTLATRLDLLVDQEPITAILRQQT